MSLTTIRIIREPANRDGWIGRTLHTNRIVFFRNLSDHIRTLSPGQIWNAQILEHRTTTDIVNLDSIVSH